MDVVIGGGGFIGKPIVRALVAAGRRVRVVDRIGPDKNHPVATNSLVQWQVADFQDPRSLPDALKNAGCVFHLASTTVPKTSDEDRAFDIQSNVVGTIGLLDACVASSVRRVVFLSSGGTIYGIPQECPIPESHPTHPVVSYGIHKLTIEKYLGLYRHSHGLDYVALRVANAYGPGQRPGQSQGAIASFMSNALLERPIEIWGDGSVRRDYIYVDDIADAVLHASRYDGNHRVFNIGSGVGLTLLELLDQIESIVGSPIERNFKPSRNFDVPANVLSIDLATAELGWKPVVALKTGLSRTRDWMRQQVKK